MSRHLPTIFMLMLFLFPNDLWSQTTSQVIVSNAQAETNTEENYKNVDYYYEGRLAYKRGQYDLAIQKLAYFLGANESILTRSSRLYAAITFTIQNCRAHLKNPPGVRLWMGPVIGLSRIPDNFLPDLLTSDRSKLSEFEIPKHKRR